MGALSAAVAAFPTSERTPDGREIRRYSAIVLDLGGHPSEAIEVLRERAARMAVQIAPSPRIRVIAFSSDARALAAYATRIEDEGFADQFAGYPIHPRDARQFWTTDVQLILGESEAQILPWLEVLEAGCAWWTARDGVTFPGKDARS